jgi:hypothetical protein
MNFAPVKHSTIEGYKHYNPEHNLIVGRTEG